jgi:hypothetical protein
VGGFEGPDTTTQPLEQGHVVCEGAKEGLAEVNVGLDQTWKDVGATRIDHAVGGSVGLSQRSNHAVPHEEIAVKDIQRVVHGHDRAVSNQRG